MKIPGGFLWRGRAKFRSTARDSETDIARISAVRAAAQRALAEASAESAGLRNRLEKVRASLGFALGSEDASFYEREDEEEKEIASLEARLLAAERRLRDLDRSIHTFTEINRLLDEMKNEIPKA
jgi:chromosome segregation ATPase